MTTSKLGPLAPLVGVWEGTKGDDVAPSDDRGTENNKYRERLVFEDIGLVENHEQRLFGLRYKTMAWRIGADDPFHEELGYWLWDGNAKQVMRCFMVPRGVAVIAGGTVEPGAKSFQLTAELGSPTYGICSNPFLDKEFKTTSYHLNVTIEDDDRWTYEEVTKLVMPKRPEPFDHTDRNTLTRSS